MEYTEHYNNKIERNELCDIANSNGFRMLHDNFDEGTITKGTLVFTDMAPIRGVTPRDYGKEIDAINERLNTMTKEVA